MTIIKRCLIIFVLILLSFSQSGCQTTPASPPSRPFKVGYFNWPGFYPVLIGLDKGFFGDLDVEPVLLEDISYTQYLNGDYAAMTSSLGDVISLNQISSESKIILIADFSNGGDAIVANPDIQTVSDLAGKSVGINYGAFGYAFVFLSTILKQHDLTIEDVHLENISANKVLESIKQGKIVAGHVWEPYVTEAKEQGLHVIFDSSQTLGLIPDVIMMSQKVAEDRPEDVAAFVKGWFQSVDFWLANPAEGNEIIATALNVPAETISLAGIELLTLADNKALFVEGGDNSIHKTAQIYIDTLKRANLLSTEPDLSKILDASFLAEE